MPEGGFAFWAYADPPYGQTGDFYYNIPTGKWRWFYNGVWANVPFTFTKGGVAENPAAGQVVLWVAPEPCTAINVRAYQNVGTGSVLTAYHNSADLLVTDITIAQAATWQAGGTLQNQSFAAGDTLSMNLVSISGSPAYVTVQVDFTDP